MNSNTTESQTEPPRPLGKNQGGYFGETIDIERVLENCLQSAAQFDWQHESLAVEPGVHLHALRRARSQRAKNLYLSTGIHGDEPAGPLAISRLLQENSWPDGLAVWLCPCLNPTGFPLNRRETAKGHDLNRQYHAPEAAETRAHITWLKQQPKFDVTICLHEDWEARGFYLYELNLDQRPSHAEAMIENVSPVCPIDHSETIEGRSARAGIIRPSADPRTRPQWPEAFYLIQNHTRHSYTLEAPSDFPLPLRVAALVTAVRTVLQTL
ncbi:MAG: M14 family metallocarboxypeptidase [Verrucomicrobia bacterium]|nr:M14 family metallocarboxypeptidase [Verrucomicrobiota bacterium]